MPDDEDYYSIFGFGYSKFYHASYGVIQELEVFVPTSDSVKVSIARFKNTTSEKRKFKFVYYVKPVLGEDETTVFIFLLKDQSLDLIPQIHDLRGIDVLADGELAGRDDAFALEPDVHQHLVMLQLHHGTVNQVTLVEIGQRAIDHGIQLIVGDIIELDDGRVLDLGQNGPLSHLRGPFAHDG